MQTKKARGINPRALKGNSDRTLAHFLNGFAQGGPFFIQALVLDLPQLFLGDIELLGYHLVRFADIVHNVLGTHQGMEYFLSLRHGQALHRHCQLLC